MEQLNRLILGDKVVGYEEHRNGKIYHSIDLEEIKYSLPIEMTLNNITNWIKHDRKDRWTGLEDKNGRKIFERDIIKSIEDGYAYRITSVIPISRTPQYDYCECISREIGGKTYDQDQIVDNPCDDWISNPEYYEVIDIEGVEE